MRPLPRSSFTYDGLWNVVDWWSERPQTEFNSGFLVYRYRLRRRPGQPVLGILTKARLAPSCLRRPPSRGETPRFCRGLGRGRMESLLAVWSLWYLG